MEKQEAEPEDTNPISPSKMTSPPHKPEFESAATSPIIPQKNHSPPREPELEHTNPTTKIFSPPRQPDESKSRNPPTKILSPQFEPEVELTNSPERYHNSKTQSTPLDLSPEEEEYHKKSPPKMLSPPLECYDNSKTQSSPLDLAPEEEEEEYHKISPFKSVTTPDADMVSPVTTKVGPTSQEVDAERGHSNLGSGRRILKGNLTILKIAKRENMVTRALLGFRICGFVFSLVSFSVLAADRDRGWALDSFYHYKEFRYCMAVNVITFTYSGFQAYDLAYQLTFGKRKIRRHLRYYLDFSVDQILSYLLISASSSAAVRVDDWQSNWGKDEFPDMARASAALSFLGFVALAVGSVISGYTLFTLKSM